MNAEEQQSPSRPVGLPPEATGARPGPMSVMLKTLSAALSGALIVLLFGAIIPKVTEFEGVGAALSSMDPIVVALLFAIAIAIRLVLAAGYAVLTPHLPVSKSLIAREASSAVSNTVPGPSGTASQYVILRSWGVGIERFAQVTVAMGVSANLLILVAPGLVFVFWALLGMPSSPGGPNMWAFGLLAIVVSVLSVAVVGAVARSVKLAAWLGRIGQACVNPFRRLFGKAPMTNWPDKFVTLRADMIEEFRKSGGRLVLFTSVGYALNGVLLVLCLWACGVPWSALPLSLGLLLYTVGRILTIVQITPGGVGVVEIVYTSIYVAALGESQQDSVVAGVLVYRALTYLLPIISGAFAYVTWRIMRRHELRRESAEKDAIAHATERSS